MAIRLITGVPGSGKSYYAVHHLVTNYCNYNKDLQEYTLKADHCIITNIDSLTLPHINLDEAVKKSGKTIHEFFMVPYQEKISQKYKKIIYLLDEAQRFFPYRNRIGSETWFYFEYHRHLGHDVYIITQDKKLVAQNITLLAENELRACKRTFSILGEFRYLLKSDNEIIDRITLRSQKKIFQIYKSFDAETSEKIINPFKKYIIILLVISLLLFICFRKIFFKTGSFTPIPSMATATEYPIEKYKSSSAVRSPGRYNQENLAETPIDAPPKPQKINLSHLYRGKNLYVVDPLTKTLYPYQYFPRPLDIKRLPGSRYMLVTADYFPDEISQFLPKESGPAQRESANSRPTI